MVTAIDTLKDALDGIEAVVVDQWGVLHDGSTPYPFAIDALHKLKIRAAVLSNSGRRAAPNLAQLGHLGFPPELFDCVMTSGEALWRDFANGTVPFTRLHPIARDAENGNSWAEGLALSLTPVEDAEAVLLMGLPENARAEAYETVLTEAGTRGLPVLCSNPDRAAPRADDARVLSPGALAHAYAARGGDARFYGKPHPPVFRAVEAALDLPPARLLMVGDSLEHDIAGAHAAGWRSLFIRGGLHSDAFREDDGDAAAQVAQLAHSEGTPLPDYTLDYLR